MPGFIIGGDGGKVPGNYELRRAHRWVFSTLGNVNQEALLVLKTASRPKLTFDEATMDHNQETVYVAGKHHWDPITLTFYDVEQDPDVSEEMYAWLQAGTGKGSPFEILTSMKVNTPKNYKKTGNLDMIDGYGDPTEQWTLYHCWPKDVNWQGLDYTSSDIQMVEVVMRYDRAVRSK